jgi:hypothetical protein
MQQIYACLIVFGDIFFAVRAIQELKPQESRVRSEIHGRRQMNCLWNGQNYELEA